jgi:hypothetical protein
LTSVSSVRDSYGRWCKAKIRAAAIAKAIRDFTVAQVEKAKELLADGGLIATKRPGVYRAVSSDGQSSYLTHPAACNCPAGLHGRRCYHVLAARILTVSTGKAA